MPTYRKLHTKIIDSYDFAEMPNDFTRVFWMLLIVVVDSEGRSIDNPAWLKSKMFPMRDDVSLDQIECAVTWIDARQMLIRYQSGGRRYFYIPKFKSYQSGTEREARSVLPAPSELVSNSGVDQEEITTRSTASVVVVVSECVNTERPNIFKVYEKEIGVLTPAIAEVLEMEEKESPAGWVEDATCEASKSNHRSVKYIQGILRNWREKGRMDAPKPNGKHKSEKVMIRLSTGELVEAQS